MDLFTLSIVFTGGIGIGIFAVVMGGTLFLSLPLFQFLFPEMALAAIIGTIKLGSIFRNTAALIPLYKQLDWSVLRLAPILCAGSLLGSWQVVSITPAIVPFVLVLGLLAHEYGGKIPLPKSLFIVIAFLVGFYGGIFGAGIMLLLLSLLKVRLGALVDARANALLLELLLSLTAVITFWYLNYINWNLAFVWTAGSIIGGVLGGMIIKRTGKWPVDTQNLLIRVAFVIALVVAMGRLL